MTKTSIRAGPSLRPLESWSLASIEGDRVGVWEGEILGSPASLPRY